MLVVPVVLVVWVVAAGRVVRVWALVPRVLRVGLVVMVALPGRVGLAGRVDWWGSVVLRVVPGWVVSVVSVVMVALVMRPARRVVSG